MFEFFGNIFYLLLLGLILLIAYIGVRNAFSKEILSKQPIALIWNNSLIILGIVLVIATFFIFAWIAGITTIVLIFIVYGLVGRKIEKEIITNIINSAKKEKNIPTKKNK